jgi:hypothetical protein
MDVARRDFLRQAHSEELDLDHLRECLYAAGPEFVLPSRHHQVANLHRLVIIML